MSAPGGPLVKPGASRTITAELAKSTNTYEGALKKVINIETNDPQTPLASLTITAYVYASLQVEPHSLLLDAITPGTAPRQELLIRNRRQEAITITRIEILPVGFGTLSPQKGSVLKPGQAFKLGVTLAPTLPLGPNCGRIILHTDWQALPEKVIPIRVHVVPAKR